MIGKGQEESAAVVRSCHGGRSRRQLRSDSFPLEPLEAVCCETRLSHFRLLFFVTYRHDQTIYILCFKKRRDSTRQLLYEAKETEVSSFSALPCRAHVDL